MKGRRNGQRKKQGQENYRRAVGGEAPPGGKLDVGADLVRPEEGAWSQGGPPKANPARKVARGEFRAYDEFRAYLPRILLTQPWLTRSWREMSQGRTPWWARSTMR